MSSKGIMAAFPPTQDKQVTLANWRRHPFSTWGFRNVRQLLPTANVPRSGNPTPLPLSLGYFEDVTFEGLNGDETTVLEALRTSFTDGLLILHCGQIAWEWYSNCLTPTCQHLIFSVSKSIAGTLGGILANQGKLDPEAAVVTYVPELKESVYGECTVRHLLDMSVGIRFDEDYLAVDGDIVRYRLSTGWDPSAGGEPATHLRAYLQTLKPDGTPHGHTFHYVSPNTDVLGWVYERACGMPYARILAHYVGGPMGAEADAYVTVDSHGAARAAGGFCATLRDLALFGEMMRNGGVSNGKQVVPGWWIDDIRTGGDADAWMRGKLAAVFPNGNYRSKWYTIDRTRKAFGAVGIHGQWIYVDPEDEAVIVRVSSQPIPMDLNLDRMWVRGYRAITTSLSR